MNTVLRAHVAPEQEIRASNADLVVLGVDRIAGEIAADFLPWSGCHGRAAIAQFPASEERSAMEKLAASTFPLTFPVQAKTLAAESHRPDQDA